MIIKSINNNLELELLSIFESSFLIEIASSYESKLIEYVYNLLFLIQLFKFIIRYY